LKDIPSSEKRAGLSRREYELAVVIGGERKSATQLASMLDLVKKKKFASLEDIWDNEGLSKNEVKRRIKAIKRWEAEMAAPALAAIAAKDSVLRCIHFGSCSGCSAEVALDDTPIMQEAKGFFSNLLPEPLKIHIGSVHRWRTLAKLAVAPSPTGRGIEIGLFKAGSHQVVSIPKCRVHHPAINEAVEVIRDAMYELNIRAYEEDTGQGDVRYLQMAVERFSGKVQLTIVWNADNYRVLPQSAHLLVKALKQNSLFHSCWFNMRDGGGNVILNYDSNKWERVFGPEYVSERIADPTTEQKPTRWATDSTREQEHADEDVAEKAKATDQDGPVVLSFPMGPNMFRQANLDQFSEIVRAAARFVPPKSKICELYGGAGLIGLSLAVPSEAVWLRCSDENPANLAAFLRMKRRMPDDVAKRVFYTAAAAEDAVMDGQADGADLLIVDPPRKGLESVAEWLADQAPASLRRVIYVSCGFSALKDDLRVLVAGGSWTIHHAEAHVLFPGSDHLETLVILDRA